MALTLFVFSCVDIMKLLCVLECEQTKETEIGTVNQPSADLLSINISIGHRKPITLGLQ